MEEKFEGILARFKWWVEDVGYIFHPPLHEVRKDEHGRITSAINMPAYAELMQGTSRKMLFLYRRKDGDRETAVMMADVIGHNGQPHPVGWPPILPDGECGQCDRECGWVAREGEGIKEFVLENQHEIPYALSQLESMTEKAIGKTEGFYLSSGY